MEKEVCRVEPKLLRVNHSTLPTSGSRVKGTHWEFKGKTFASVAFQTEREGTESLRRRPGRPAFARACCGVRTPSPRRSSQRGPFITVWMQANRTSSAFLPANGRDAGGARSREGGAGSGRYKRGPQRLARYPVSLASLVWVWLASHQYQSPGQCFPVRRLAGPRLRGSLCLTCPGTNSTGSKGVPGSPFPTNTRAPVARGRDAERRGGALGVRAAGKAGPGGHSHREPPTALPETRFWADGAAPNRCCALPAAPAGSRCGSVNEAV